MILIFSSLLNKLKTNFSALNMTNDLNEMLFPRSLPRARAIQSRSAYRGSRWIWGNFFLVKIHHSIKAVVLSDDCCVHAYCIRVMLTVLPSIRM